MKDLKFKYIFNEDYNPQYVNGAFGGVNSQGEIIIHFFCERGAIPYQVDQTVDENGSLSEPIHVNPEDIEGSFVRFVQSGVILDREHAHNIYAWLGKVLGENHEE